MFFVIAGSIGVNSFCTYFSKVKKLQTCQSFGYSLCNSSQKSESSVILGAWVVPCPGSALLFMSIFILGALWAGPILAIAMSIGMALMIGLSASLGAVLHKGVEGRSWSILRLLESIAPAVILLIGLVMMGLFFL